MTDPVIRGHLMQAVEDVLMDLDAELRQVLSGRPQRPRTRAPAMIVALFVAGAGLLFAWWAFTSGEAKRPSGPTTPAAPTLRNGAIAFVLGHEGDRTIHVMEPDGTGVRQLAAEVPDAHAPAWSPDGSRIAFAGEHGDHNQIFVMNADGTGITRLTDLDGIADSPAWSPDGTLIAFTDNAPYGGHQQNHQLYVMRTDGSDVRRLTDQPAVVHNSAPSWSPDGSRIVFTGIEPVRLDCPPEVHGCPLSIAMHLYTIDVVGGAPRQLTAGPREQEPSWSPDGSQIVFEDHNDILVMRPDGTGIHSITGGIQAHPDYGNFDPVWSPLGDRIAFVSERTGTLQIYTMAPDGHDIVRLTEGKQSACCPSWQPLVAAVHETPSATPHSETSKPSPSNAATKSPSPSTESSEPSLPSPPAGAEVIRLNNDAESVPGPAFGFGSVWIPNYPAVSIERIDPVSGRVIAVIPAEGAELLAFGEGSVWAVGSSGVVSRIDPSTNRVVTSLSIGSAGDSIAVGAGAVWIVAEDDDLIRIDPLTNEVVARAETGLYLDQVVASNESVWVLEQVLTLWRVDPATNDLIRPSITIGERNQLALGEGALWVASQATGEITKLDPVSGRILDVIPLAGESVASGGPFDLVVGDGAVWAYSQKCCGFAPRLWRIDPVTDEVTEIPIPEGVYLGAVGAGWLWFGDLTLAPYLYRLRVGDT